VYIYYTVPGNPAHNRVSWFSSDGFVVTGSEQPIVDLPDLGPTNHNGGALHFGNDGQLYIGVGENGNGANAQDLATPLGKVLRITPDGAPAAGNPFADGPGGNDDRIWAYGLRNPFTFAVRPSDGHIFIDDVGQNTWEEIDDGIAGANYGWPQTEGPTTAPGITPPLYAYSHADGSCAIAGGTFFESGLLGPEYANRYFFSDLCSGWIKAFSPADGSVIDLASGIDGPVDLRTGPDNWLWYLAHGSGVVGRIVPNDTERSYFLRNSPSTGAADSMFSYGQPGDLPLFCDWDGNGTDTIGVFRRGVWFLRNANTTGAAEGTFSYGDPGDIPVCGDWNADGKDTVGVFRRGVFYLENTNRSGVADRVVGFGDVNDRPVTGDWDGDGDTNVGVFRAGAFYLRDRNITGVADRTFGYGDAADYPLTGDWNGDGTTTIGVWRPGQFLLRDSNSTGVADLVAQFGDATDGAAVGDFDGAGGTGIAVVR
jgi:hypothetical protein